MIGMKQERLDAYKKNFGGVQLNKKYKDAEPKDTINRIKSILNEIGIDLVCQTEKHVDGVFTSYLTDPICRWRTEGKGTTIEYCEASAYGEAMEHLCTHYAFDISTISEEATKYKGFYRYPDEQVFPVEKILELSPVIVKEMQEPFERLGRDIPQNSDLISLWKKILKSDTTSFVPFFHVNQKKNVLLPDAILSKLCGTNGGGCGNSPEEAIGHALDEIVERWCKYIIFSQRLTPPQVPDTYIEKRCPELLKLKQEIQNHGNLKVLIMDASLGKGYPVMLIVIIDPYTQRYLVNFGCHPQFEIALERCFTEIFQDRRIVPNLLERKDMAVWANFDRESIYCQRNWAKLLEDDLGIWPEELFGELPSWQFSEWTIYEDYTNKIGMLIQLERLQEDGAEIFIRNVGFLGFPVYKVYVHGRSTSHINFTEDILFDLNVVNNIEPFLRGELEKDKMYDFGEKLFGKDSILGRMFFYRLSNEEFDLLHAAFLMEYDNMQSAYKLIRPWNGEEAIIARRILEMAQYMELSKAISCAKTFSSTAMCKFTESFFSDHPFSEMLTYYKFSSNSRQSMSGKTIQPQRDALIMKMKDYMCSHLQAQDTIETIVG